MKINILYLADRDKFLLPDSPYPRPLSRGTAQLKLQQLGLTYEQALQALKTAPSKTYSQLYGITISNMSYANGLYVINGRSLKPSAALNLLLNAGVPLVNALKLLTSVAQVE